MSLELMIQNILATGGYILTVLFQSVYHILDVSIKYKLPNQQVIVLIIH